MATTSSRRRRPRSGWSDLDPVGVGRGLRAARDRLRLTIEEAADATRIRPTHLAALEDEDFETLPDAVHARGLLRAYTTFLGVDAIELLSALEARGRLELGCTTLAGQLSLRRAPPHHERLEHLHRRQPFGGCQAPRHGAVLRAGEDLGRSRGRRRG